MCEQVNKSVLFEQCYYITSEWDAFAKDTRPTIKAATWAYTEHEHYVYARLDQYDGAVTILTIFALLNGNDKDRRELLATHMSTPDAIRYAIEQLDELLEELKDVRGALLARTQE